MKCHWCSKEVEDERRSYCSNRCWVEYDCRFEWWMNQFGLHKDEVSVDWLMNHLTFGDDSIRITNLKEKLENE